MKKNQKNLNQTYRRNIIMNDKEIITKANLDNQPYNEQLDEDYVAYTKQIKTLEVPDFNPTREELIQIIKYWAEEILRMDYESFLDGCWCGSQTHLQIFGVHQINRIKEVLGKEAVKQAISETNTKFAEAQDKRLWDIFVNGTKEQWDAVQEETHKALEKAQEEDEKAKPIENI